MFITLVTASFNDEVHGTFNDKRTGCGINLAKPENLTRYRRGGNMTDLGEITCERCKVKIAKEMIKSDQKEMKALLKEERLRMKKGIEDEGIIPLGNTTAKITSAPQPAPPPPPPAPAPAPVQQQPPKPAYQPNGAPALNDDLAQFAINKPVETQEEKPNYFEAERPVTLEKAPAPAAQNDAPPVDDFLAQFAIQKPDEAPVEETNDEADFLAQFAVDAPKEEPQPAPAAPPVIDDISAAINAMEQNSFMSQNTAPAPQAQPQAETRDYQSDWDTLANQLFTSADEAAPVEAPKPAADVKAPVLDEIGDSIAEASAAAKEAVSVIDEELTAPILDDIGNSIPDTPAVVKQVISSMEEGIKAPVLEDIGGDIPQAPAPAPVQPAPAPVQPAPAPVQPAQPEPMPVIDDISEAISAMNIPAAPKTVTAAPMNDDMVLEDISDDDDEDAFELISSDLEPKAEKAPVLDDIGAAISAMNNAAPIQPAQPAAAPVQPAPAQPVINDISAAISAMNTPVQPAARPVQPVPVRPVPVQPVPVQAAPAPTPAQPVPVQAAPAPAPVQPTPVPVQPVRVAPVAPAPAPTPANAAPVGQILSVPQITGYDSLNQPIYSYIQMQIQSYDQNGQPILVPLPGQEMPAPNELTFSQRFNQNTRLRDAIAAAQEIPTATKDMTPGQKIAAANAAKGDPISANVSKIATNPHTKATSQAFISAISESKEYANQSLTETQGLQQRTSVLNSIEDVLSQLGDNSLKEKKMAEAKAQTNVPTYQEYKAPAPRNTYSAPRPSAPAPKPAQPEERFLTKAELKAKKKQDKIDAKFQKEMLKRK